jgi:hypothetical protein
MLARVLGLFLLLPLAAQAAETDVETKRDPSRMTAKEISQCVQQNFPDDTMKQTVRMVMKDRMGVERLLVLEKEPKNDMFMYLPELAKTRRITSSMVNGNMMGTDFTYEDFARLQGMLGNLDAERLPDEEFADRAAFVTDSVPSADSDSEYQRIRSVIDQETCVSLQVEFFEKGHEGPVKRLTVDPSKIEKSETGWFPRAIQMEDLRGGTSTDLVIEKLEIGTEIHRKMFSAGELDKRGRFKPAVTRF